VSQAPVLARSTPPGPPRLRGRLHRIAAVAAVPAGIALVLRAGGTAARTGAAVYAVTLVGLFVVSALYHIRFWEPGPRQVMRRLDHSMIFVFIAGSYTPFCLAVLGGGTGAAVLAAAWIGAALGVASQVTPRLSTHRAHYVLYIALGWLVMLTGSKVVSGLSATQLVLLFGGGLLYTAGAVVLALKRPNPHPGIFGYHEVWHAMVVLACVCHFVLLWWILA
jgi:hemolysin III